jgi:predicted RNA methylase
MNFENHLSVKQKKERGVFYTPEDISQFMSSKTKIFDDGGVWLDPCCGLGILSITLASMQDDPVDFVKNRLIINDTDKNQLDNALINFKEKFGVTPKYFNHDFLSYDFECDYIIMNPPYFKYKDNDIYAYFLQKACQISKGFISINPISFTNGVKFREVRKSILDFSSITMYHFDTIPGHIFEDADVRVSIVIVHNKNNVRKTTTQIRWSSDKRKEMIQNLDNNLDDGIFTEDIFYKTSPNTSHLIHEDTLSKYVVSHSDYPIYVTSSPRYFITASSEKLDRTGQIEIFMKDAQTHKKALIMLNSSYLYWWWRTSDSSMSLTKRTLVSLPWVDIEYNDDIIHQILQSEKQNKVYKLNAGKMQENIKHPKSLVSKLNSLFIDEDMIKLHD